MVKQTFDSTTAGEGHRLSSENNTNTAMDIDELRARRLAALSSSSSSSTGANTYSRKTTTTSTTINGTQNNESTMYSTHTTENNNINNNSTSSSSNNKAVDVKESKSKQPSSSSSSSSSSPSSSSSSGVICIEPLVTSSLDSLIHEFNSIMWDDNITTHADKIRWVEQGIHTNILIQDRDSNSNTKNNADGSRNITQHDSWGLQQSHGGPCGVLAALQAELISRLNIVQQDNNNHNGRQIIQMPIIAKEYTVEDIQKALADSIACILVRACIAPTMMQKKDHTTAAAAAAAGNIDITDDNDDNEFCVRLFLPKNNDDCKSGTNDLIASEDLLSLYSGNNRSTTNTKQMKLQCVSIKYNHYNDEEGSKTPEAKRAKAATAAAAAVKTTTTSTTTTTTDIIMNKLTNATSDYLLSTIGLVGEKINLEHFYHQGGVLLFTLSLVATRGVEQIKNDMDDETNQRLTAQFGHSSQELMNLLLTGQATTNTFDKTMILGGSLQCHGVQSQSSIGYLTQLEALRYCSVGNYYKSPKNPVWVVGSTSHFSVLFGSNESLRESKSDLLLEKVRRAFKAVDTEENGFIPVTELHFVLKEQLGLDLKEGVTTLAAALELSGAGIILWNEFWKKVSRLLTGASLENVLQDGHETTGSSIHAVRNQSTSTIASEDDMPLLLTQYGDNAATHDTTTAAAAASISNNNGNDPTIETDEQLARRLAAEWGSDQAWGEPTSSFVVNEIERPPNPMVRQLEAQAQALAFPEEEETQQNPQGEYNGLKFEKYNDDSFQLYHYNGLRGGQLTCVTVTRMSPEEAVGANASISNANGTSGIGSIVDGNTDDLESVIRTKYPSCMFDWQGRLPPSLH